MPKKLNERELIARRLNNLKKLICKVTDNLGYIENEFVACGGHDDSWWHNFRKLQREQQESILLGRLDDIAKLNKIEGDYSTRTTWINTPEGRRWKAQHDTIAGKLDAVDAQMKARYEAMQASLLKNVTLGELGISERRALDSGSLS